MVYYGKDGRVYTKKETPKEYSRRRLSKGLDPKWLPSGNSGCLIILLIGPTIVGVLMAVSYFFC